LVLVWLILEGLLPWTRFLNNKVDIPHSPIFKWYVVRYGSKTYTKKTCVQKGLDYMLKIFEPFYAQQSTWLTGSTWPHNEHKILTLIMNKIFIWALKIMKQMATDMIWQPSHTNCVFHILPEVGAERQVSLNYAHLPWSCESSDCFMQELLCGRIECRFWKSKCPSKKKYEHNLSLVLWMFIVVSCSIGSGCRARCN
jgi:hypothetical protein